jgi:uncharacterized tellurite resistance protein B-like protein
MSDVMNIFQASSSPAQAGFDIKQLTEQFHTQRNTDWTVAEAFVCLLLAASAADGVVSQDEQAEIRALVDRSRALKSVPRDKLAAINAVVSQRLQSRPNGLREACESLPADMRLTVFAHCCDIILLDGTLQPVEADFLNRIMSFLAIGAEDGKRVLEVLLVKNRF